MKKRETVCSRLIRSLLCAVMAFGLIPPVRAGAVNAAFDFYVPPTGDDSRLTLWIVLAVIALCAIIVLLLISGKPSYKGKYNGGKSRKGKRRS